MIAYDRGDWGMIGIKAKAEINTWQEPNTWKKIDTITSGGLWGIENDQKPENYKDIENDQLDELKATLKEFGFTEEQINSAPIEIKTN